MQENIVCVLCVCVCVKCCKSVRVVWAGLVLHVVISRITMIIVVIVMIIVLLIHNFHYHLCDLSFL